MLKKILLFLVVVIGIILIVAAFQPSTFHVERSITIAAPVADVFPQVNDLRKVAAWSPWMQLDPAIKVTYEGPASGVGASSAWSGNSEVGEGRQTIVESRPNELVKTRLDFEKPMKSTCFADFALKAQNGQTVVTWSMYGDSSYLAKVFCLFMNQDKMIGEPFEKGLANLKALVESGKK